VINVSEILASSCEQFALSDASRSRRLLALRVSNLGKCEHAHAHADLKNLERRQSAAVVLLGRAAEPIATTPSELPHSQRLPPDPTFGTSLARDIPGWRG
jgi:hypothetical protein